MAGMRRTPHSAEHSAGRSSSAPAPGHGAVPWASPVLLVLLAGAGLVLAFRSGSYMPGAWLPVSLGVAAVTAMLVAFLPEWSLGRRASAFLLVFAGLTVLAGASILWAEAPAQAWQEANRSLLYLLALILVVAAVGWGGNRSLLLIAAVVAGIVAIVGIAVVMQLNWAEDPARLFQGGRLHYPVTYWNGLGALLMLGFWPMLGLASARQMPVWGTAALAGGAVALAELALLPESRGALWTFFLVVPFFILVTPHRFRALALLGVVGGTIVLAWPSLIGVYEAFSGAEGGGGAAGVGAAGAGGVRMAVDAALEALVWSVAGVAAAGAVIRVIEKRISPLSRTAVRVVSAVLVVFALGAAALGLVTLRAEVGDLTDFAERQWSTFTADRVGDVGDGSRFTGVGLNGRLQQWRIAGQAFTEKPVTGLGAQNYEYYFYRHRETGLQVRQPHSQPMQVLSELGIGGAVLYAGFFGGALLWGLVARFRARRPENQAAMAALFVTGLSWFIHSSADWLWQLAGVTWPAVLVFGGLIAGGGLGGDGGDPAPARRRGHSPQRPLIGLVAMVAFLSALFPYLSIRYTDDVAYGSIAAAPTRAIDASQTAAAFNPFSAKPYRVQASTYERLATRAEGDDDSRERLAYLGLAAAAREEAFAHDPAWHPAVAAAESVEALAKATGEVSAGRSDTSGAGNPATPKALGASAAETSDATPAVSVRAVELEALTVRELFAEARGLREKAARLNPREAERLLQIPAE